MPHVFANPMHGLSFRGKPNSFKNCTPHLGPKTLFFCGTEHTRNLLVCTWVFPFKAVGWMSTTFLCYFAPRIPQVFADPMLTEQKVTERFIKAEVSKRCVKNPMILSGLTVSVVISGWHCFDARFFYQRKKGAWSLDIFWRHPPVRGFSFSQFLVTAWLWVWDFFQGRELCRLMVRHKFLITRANGSMIGTGVLVCGKVSKKKGVEKRWGREKVGG